MRGRFLAMVAALAAFRASAARAAGPFVAAPGDRWLSVEHEGRTRTCLVHVPPQYDPTHPMPLVLFFHGGMGTAEQAAASYGWSEKADKEGFLVAYPNGTGRLQTWNAVHGCGAAFREGVDDVGFVR